MEGSSALILLLHLSVMPWGCLGAGVPHLRRHKRDWVVPTKMLRENFDYTTAGYVAKIRSDQDVSNSLYYTLLGPGASEEPVNQFVVEDATGLVYVRGKLDREKIETYILTGEAKFKNGSVAEGNIALKFDVEDENDNPPVFVPVPPATVKESSPAGTLVGMITATDADKVNSPHATIAYSIEKQEPSDARNLFYMNRETGAIYVRDNTLDREKQSSYILTVTGSDMNGVPGGNTGTGTIHVQVVDINDHVPTLEKDQYAGSIVENTAQVEVMRFRVLDADEEKTDNWLAVFDIVTGNEDGTFSIKTDPKTNDGVLMLEKPVDFEENPNIKLGVVVANVAPAWGDGGGGEGAEAGAGGGGGGGGGGAGAGAGAGGGGGGGGAGAGAGAGGGGGGGGGGAGAGGGGSTTNQSMKKGQTKGKVYPVNIAVQNVREGVAFRPSVKPVSVSERPEENPLMKVITVFRATDTDTGEPADNVRYAKGYDPENWLLIDPETAEIRLQKAPDRESPFVVDGTYYAKILSLSQDVPPQMVTGTIALQVGDVNDNCPTLTPRVDYICSDAEVVNVSAVDEDGDPNSAPFSFRLAAEESQGEWRVEPLNDTSTSLRALRPLWPGHYQVALIIQDQQGFACPDPQVLDLHVCSCAKGETCRAAGLPDRVGSLKETSSAFGGVGLGTLILGLLMLLIGGLLLMTCSCGRLSRTFSELPFDARERLIVYHTEGRGESKEVPLVSSAVLMTPAATSTAWDSNIASTIVANTATSSAAPRMGAANQMAWCGIQEGGLGESRGSWRELCSTKEELPEYEDTEGIALSDVFLHQYYSEKASHAAEKQAARDCLCEYDYEGQGSAAGSVGCCSLLESNSDLHFLDDLGPKFKTLAAICSPPAPQSIATSEVDMVDDVAGPSLVARTHSLRGIPEHDENVSISGFNEASASSMHRQSSTSATGFNGAGSRRVHRQSSLSTSSMAPSPLVSPVAMLPSPGQVLLLQQQPVYYTSSPVMQPMHYIIQPQFQSTMLLAEAPVGDLPGMILHGGITAGATLGRARGNTALARQYSIGMLTGPHIGLGATESEEGQLVFTQRGNMRRTRSTSFIY